MNSIDSLHGLVWHLECMSLSGREIENFHPPADSFQMRMHYSLYLTNLMSAIDMVAEWCGEPFNSELLDGLKTPSLSGSDILGYVRELRNGVVHRGVDPTNGGTQISGCVWAVSPPTVKDRKGVRSYSAPTPLLRDLFIHCEVRAKPIIKRFIQPNVERLNSISPDAMLADIFGTMEAFPHVPDWVTEMAREHITTEILEMARTHHWGKLDDLLRPSADQPLVQM